MHELEHALDLIARHQDNVLGRQQVLEAGGSDRYISGCLERGRWQPLQAGAYLVGSAPPTWYQSLRGALFAAGPSAEVSRRAALRMWGLDGLGAVPRSWWRRRRHRRSGPAARRRQRSTGTSRRMAARAVAE